MQTVYIKRNDLFRDMQMILCNNITQADENFVSDNCELFFSPCDACVGGEDEDFCPCVECGGEGEHETEPYQFFIVDPDEWQRERLQSYNIELGYSELFEQWILPIYDFGTSWDAFSYSKEVPNDYSLAQNETNERKTHY